MPKIDRIPRFYKHHINHVFANHKIDDSGGVEVNQRGPKKHQIDSELPTPRNLPDRVANLASQLEFDVSIGQNERLG